MKMEKNDWQPTEGLRKLQLLWVDVQTINWMRYANTCHDDINKYKNANIESATCVNNKCTMKW